MISYFAKLLIGEDIKNGRIEIEGSQIREVELVSSSKAGDRKLQGVLVPGIYDLQVNGAAGYEISDGDDALEEIDKALLEQGVVAYLPTLISPDQDFLNKTLPSLSSKFADITSPAKGLHAEGPWLAREKSGAHPDALFMTPTLEEIEWLLKTENLKIITLAPEVCSPQIIRAFKNQGVIVSLGHSIATYNEARLAFQAGASAVTHFLNAAPPILAREPGILGAALEDSYINLMLIADQIHVHPMIVKMMIDHLYDRLILVSDIASPAGAIDGDYRLRGRDISKEGDKITLKDSSTLAGAATFLLDQIRGLVELTGHPFNHLWSLVSTKPAYLMGIDHRIVKGARADLIELDPFNLNVETVILAGREVASI